MGKPIWKDEGGRIKDDPYVPLGDDGRVSGNPYKSNGLELGEGENGGSGLVTDGITGVLPNS